MGWSLAAIACSALLLWDLAGAAPSASAPPQLDERILFELARNPELLQIVNDYLDKKSGESPVSAQTYSVPRRGGVGSTDPLPPFPPVVTLERRARRRGRRRPPSATRRSAAAPDRPPIDLSGG